MTANLVLAFYYHEALLPFTLPALFNLGIALVAALVSHKQNEPTQFKKKEAYLTVTIAMVCDVGDWRDAVPHFGFDSIAH